MAYLQIFIYLQILDFLTTMVGFRFGASEASPAIRWLVQFGPAGAVIVSKITAVGIAMLCMYLKKQHLVKLINFWYAGLVVWNLWILLSLNVVVRRM